MFRLVVGGVFIWAGVLKIVDPLGFAQNIKNYRIVGHDISFFLALILPWLEVFCGIFLIIGFWQRASALLTSAMLLGFIALVVITIARGIDIDCGCFGQFSRKLDYKLLMSDCLFLFFSLNIYFFKHKKSA
jgi:putative oxidoreductase